MIGVLAISNPCATTLGVVAVLRLPSGVCGVSGVSDGVSGRRDGLFQRRGDVWMVLIGMVTFRIFGVSESEGRFLRYVNSIRSKCLEGCASLEMVVAQAMNGGLMTSGQGCRPRAVSISKARTAVHISHSWKPHDANEACL
jgi:hypothetical protein